MRIPQLAAWACVIGLAAAAAPVLASAFTGFEFLVCGDAPASQSMPAASGTRVVWADQRSGGESTADWDIYMYDLATGVEQPICKAAGDQLWPEIDGDRIVWMDHRSGAWAVYCYDLRTRTERKLSDAPIPDPHTVWQTGGPDISGSRVVWADYRTGNLDVFLYDLSTGKVRQITHDRADQGEQGPRIHGSRIVYRDMRHNRQGDICLYDLRRGRQTVIAGDKTDHAQPDIWGNVVVWRQWGRGGFDIWYRDLRSKTNLPLATGSEIEDHPRVNARHVVWGRTEIGHDNAVAWQAVGAFDLRSQTKIALNVGGRFCGQLGPGLSDSGIVVYQDFRNGTRNPESNGDIYGYWLASAADLLRRR